MTERQFRDMWVDPADDPRDEQPWHGEVEVVRGYLSNYRMTIEMKMDGLDDEQLARRSVPPSTMSLLGLLRHMAQVEHNWNRRVLQAQDLPRLYSNAEDRDADFNGAVADPAVVAEAWEAWRREVADANAWIDNDS